MATFRDPKTGMQLTVPDEVLDDYVSRGQADAEPPAPAEPVAKPRRRPTKPRPEKAS